ncbi:MAG: DUF5667 domain-containing protein, partial [Anaerolineales bacterium]
PLRKASARQNYLVHASRLRAERGRSRNLASQSIFAGLRMAFRAMTVVVLVVSALLTGTIYAAADSLPGDLLYPLNLQVEEARLGWEPEPDRAARLALSFADKRLNEIERLITAGRQKDIPVALQEYQRILAGPRLSEHTVGQAELSAVIVERLTAQEKRLLAIHSNAGAQNSTAFEAAVDVLESRRNWHALNAPGHENPGQGNPNPPGLQNPPVQVNPVLTEEVTPGQDKDKSTPPGQDKDKPIPPGQDKDKPTPPGQGNPGGGNPNPPGGGKP